MKQARLDLTYSYLEKDSQDRKTVFMFQRARQIRINFVSVNYVHFHWIPVRDNGRLKYGKLVNGFGKF